MSRIGVQPVPVPDGVTVDVKGRSVAAKGPKGELSMSLTDGISVHTEGGSAIVTRENEQGTVRAMHGTTRALLANMITGVNTGFKKVLQVWGVGYTASVKQQTLSLNIGFCHNVDMPIPEGLEVQTERGSVEGTNIWRIVVSGADKHAVGQFAADVRAKRPPEPYKGKGIRYEGERVSIKAGKSF